MTELHLSAAELYAEHSGNDEFLRVTAQGEEAPNEDTEALHGAARTVGVGSDGHDVGGRGTVELASHHSLAARRLEVGQATSRGRMQASSARTDSQRIPFRHLVAALREADKIAAEKRDGR